MADIEVEVKGEVTWIRLNRADRMNAYDGPMAETMIEGATAFMEKRKPRFPGRKASETD